MARPARAYGVSVHQDTTPADMPGFERSMTEMFANTARNPRPNPEQAIAGLAPQIADARAVFPQSQDLAIIAIGDAAKIREWMKAYGPLSEMKLTDPRFSP